MPTPFTHLAFAQRALNDAALPARYATLLRSAGSGFLLGSVAADARVGAGTPRDRTHFYIYGQDIVEHPWRVMMQRSPALWMPQDAEHQAFVAGYVAHLAMDEYWSLHMVQPHFVQRKWAADRWRYLMLHVILIYMDERDYRTLESWQAETLHHAVPHQWLDFLPDVDLNLWRDLIYEQIKPHGISHTYDIFGQRVGMSAEELRALMDTDQKLHDHLWQYIPLSVLSDVEQGMYRFALEQMTLYLDEAASAS